MFEAVKHQTMRFTLLVLFFVFLHHNLLAQYDEIVKRAEILRQQLNSDSAQMESPKNWDLSVMDDLNTATAKANIKEFSKAYATAESLFLRGWHGKNKSLVDTAFSLLVQNGIKAMEQSSPIIAIEFFIRAEEIATTTNDNSKRAKALSELGKALAKNYEPDKGIEKLIDAIKINETLKASLPLAENYNDVGEMYRFIGESERALVYFNKSLEIADRIKNNGVESNALTGLGRTYIQQQNYKAAYNALLKAAILDQDLKNHIRLAETQLNLAYLSFQNTKDYPDAIQHAEKSNHYFKENPENSVTDNYIEAIVRLSGYFRHINKTQVADMFLKIILSYNTHVIHNNYNTAKIYHEFALNSAYREEYESAYKYINLYHDFNNNTIEERKNRAVRKLEIEYETQKKELTIARQQKDLAISKLFGAEKQKALAVSQAETQQKELALQRKQNELIAEQLAKAEAEKQRTLAVADKLKTEAENQAQRTLIIYIIIAAVALLLLATAIYYFLQKQSKLHFSIRALQSKMVASKSQVDAHFTSNAFATLQNIINQNPLQAETYIHHLYTFIRNSLDQSDFLEISLQEELNALTNYLRLEQIRLENAFTYTINIAPDIQPATINVPALILQPITENAIIHGFSNITYHGQLTIDIQTINNQINYTVTDNGVGRKVKPDNPVARKSKGTKITEERLRDFAQLQNKKSTFLITDLPQGVQVQITFPLVNLQQA